MQFITRVQQVLQVLDNRQARPHVSVVQELAARFARRQTQLVIVIHRRGVGLFVRRDHMEAFAQEVRVLIGNRLVRRTIDNHRVQQVILFHQTDQTPKVERLFCLVQLGLPVFQVQPVNVGQQRF